MLRKRVRSGQTNLEMGQFTSDDGCKAPNILPDVPGQKQKTSPFYSVPGLFVGMAPNCVLDCDSVRSPTSPLDFKLFSNLGGSFRFPKPNRDGHQKCWECDKVGLSIVDSLGDDEDEEDGNSCGKTLKSTNSKNILLGLQIRNKSPNSPSHLKFCESPKSLPKSYPGFAFTQTKSSDLQKGKSDVLFEIGEDPLEPDPSSKIRSFSLDSKRIEHYLHRNHCRASFGFTGRPPSANGSLELYSGSEKLSSHNLELVAEPIGSCNGFIGHLSASEIELSEDYTCIITRGPNPKTTHIFGDCILEGHTISSRKECGKEREGMQTDGFPVNQNPLEQNPSDSHGFLSFCNFCNKKLESGRDIYMYRGEKAFCSLECRLEEILIEEGKEKSTRQAPKESPESKFDF